MLNENNMVKCSDKVEVKEAATAPAGRQRNGKIARLPLAIRQELNRRLQDGERGSSLAEWLNGRPEVQAILAAQFNGAPISQDNLSQWRKGGYKNWEDAQKAVQDVAVLFEKSASVQEAAKDELAQRMSVLVAAKMAGELIGLDALPEGARKSRRWRELLSNLALLRRGDCQGERLKVEREKLGFRRELHQRERETEFWQWIQKAEYRDKILDRLLTPEQNAAEIARRKEENRRKMRAILGLREPSAVLPAAEPIRSDSE